MELPIYFNQRFSRGAGTSEQFGYSTSINDAGNIISVGTYGGSGVYVYKSGQNGSWYLVDKLTGQKSSDLEIGKFGYDLKLNGLGNILAVSAPFRDGEDFSPYNGRVFIYTGINNSWILNDQLNGIPGFAQYFGHSLDVNYLGDTIAVSSRGQGVSGQVYIYTNYEDNWQLSRILTGKSNSFSYPNSVSLNKSGNLIAFGSAYENQNSGKVYILDWKIPYQINLNNFELTDNSEDINGIYTYQSIVPFSYAATSGYKHNSLDSWIYFSPTNNRWELEANDSPEFYNDSSDINILPFTGWKIGLAQGAPDELTTGIINYIPKQITGGNTARLFGINLDLNNDGDKILIGSWYSDLGSGAAYLFTGNNSNWILSKKFTGDNNDNNLYSDQRFGYKVDLNGDGNIALISESKDFNGNGPSAGAVYVFSNNGTWGLNKKITGDYDIDFGDNFGFSFALNDSGNIAIIGSIGDGNNYKGAAYLYSNANIQYSNFAGETEVIYNATPIELKCDIITGNFSINLDGQDNFTPLYNTKHKFIIYKSGINYTTGYLPIYESEYSNYNNQNIIKYSGSFDKGNYQIKIKSIYNDTNISFPNLCNNGIQVANIIDVSYSNKSGLALFKNCSSTLYKDFLNNNSNLNEVANIYITDRLDITGFDFINDYKTYVDYIKTLEPVEKEKEGISLNSGIDHAVSRLNWKNKIKIINIVTNNIPYIESDADDCEVALNNDYFTNPIEIKYSDLLNKMISYSNTQNISFNFIYLDKELNLNLDKKNCLYDEKDIKILYEKAAQLGKGSFGNNNLSQVINSQLNLSNNLKRMRFCESSSSSSSSAIDQIFLEYTYGINSPQVMPLNAYGGKYTGLKNDIIISGATAPILVDIVYRKISGENIGIYDGVYTNLTGNWQIEYFVSDADQKFATKDRKVYII